MMCNTSNGCPSFGIFYYLKETSTVIFMIAALTAAEHAAKSEITDQFKTLN